MVYRQERRTRMNNKRRQSSEKKRGRRSNSNAARRRRRRISFLFPFFSFVLFSLFCPDSLLPLTKKSDAHHRSLVFKVVKDRSLKEVAKKRSYKEVQIRYQSCNQPMLSSDARPEEKKKARKQDGLYTQRGYEHPISGSHSRSRVQSPDKQTP